MKVPAHVSCAQGLYRLLDAISCEKGFGPLRRPVDPRIIAETLLDIPLIGAANLTIAQVKDYLEHAGVDTCSDDFPTNRVINGYLYVRQDRAFIFYETARLATAHQGYPIAHEVGHYLSEYRMPLERLAQVWVSGVDRALQRRVLQGQLNQDTPSVLILRVLAGVGPLQSIAHRGERSPDNLYERELFADAFAAEILCSWDEAVGMARVFGPIQFVRYLEDRQGFPHPKAIRYASDIEKAISPRRKTILRDFYYFLRQHAEEERSR